MCPNQTTMKHISTFTLLLAMGLGAFAQSMPYNPDSNGDDFVGVDDVLGVLGVYNTTLIDSTLTCDYEGTELENLLAGVFNGEIVLDSVYVEYLLIDSLVTYTPGCPDPVITETVLNRSYMFDNLVDESTPNLMAFQQSVYPMGLYRAFQISYSPLNGGFQVQIQDNEVSAFTGYSSLCWFNHSLPFPSTSFLDDNGIQSDSWNAYSGSVYNTPWVVNAQNFRMIPFWHEAE